MIIINYEGGLISNTSLSITFRFVNMNQWNENARLVNLIIFIYVSEDFQSFVMLSK